MCLGGGGEGRLDDTCGDSQYRYDIMECGDMMTFAGLI